MFHSIRRSWVALPVLLACGSTFMGCGCGSGGEAGEAPVALAVEEHGVWTLGHAGFGQLGDGGGSYYVLTPSSPILQGVKQADGGLTHSVALMSDTTVRAWGGNAYGQLGDGSRTDRSSPTTVIFGAIAVAVGGNHTVALMADGTLRAWGWNAYGQIGDGTKSDRDTPVTVVRAENDPTPLSGVAAIAAGADFTIALMSDATLRAWGRNTRGQLGDGTKTDRAAPAAVQISRVKAVAAGFQHSMALLANGTAAVWGDGTYGQLGTGQFSSSATPVILSLSSVAAVAAGEFHSLALLADGTVRAWGMNTQGQLGDGTTANRAVPVTVVVGLQSQTALSSVIAVAGGGGHTLALLSDGTMRAWGANAYGQLGIGNMTESPVPVAVSGLAGVSSIGAGRSHSAAVLNDGTLRSWGSNSQGQVGDGTEIGHPTPSPVDGLSEASAVSAGWQHTLVLLQNGRVMGFGFNGHGALGDGTRWSSSSPVMVMEGNDVLLPLENVQAISAGGLHSVALLEDGTVHAWGYNDRGQLGNGSNVDRSTATPVIAGASNLAPLSNVVAVSAGRMHTAALLADGTVRTWGSNGSGQLGDGGGTAERWAPVTVIANAPTPSLGNVLVTSPTIMSPPALSDVIAIASGSYHTVALMKDGTLRAWGLNGEGQLGDGTRTNRNAPVTVVKSLLDPTPLSGVTAVAAGYDHTVALLNDGTVRIWGGNEHGQLGDATNDRKLAPVSLGLSGVASVAAGFWDTAVILDDGAVRAWGWNRYAQLGDGTLEDRNVPASVQGIVGAIDVAFGRGHLTVRR